MRTALAIVLAAAVTACGSSVDFSQNCSMKVSVNGGAQQTVQCFAAGASTAQAGNAVSISMTGTLPDLQAAQFAMMLPAAPSQRTYSAAADVSSAFGQVRTGTNALYVQNVSGTIGSFSVVLTSVSSASSGGDTAYFLRGSATVTLVGQGAPGTATMTATF
jgi:hypothetical protein